MWLSRFSRLLLWFFVCAWVLPAAAQLPGSPPDPLARIREAAKSNVQACSATGENLCEQVAPKIISNAQGDSPLADNLKHLEQIRGASADNAPLSARIMDWAVSAFRAGGLDVHKESFLNSDGTKSDTDNVVAEIQGREKPGEWVLVGAHLDDGPSDSGGANSDCDPAMVIEAARDIARTGIHPRRSIRFVLFSGSEKAMSGSWAYVVAHRAELDRARGSIVFSSGCARIAGYTLGGRHDIEPGVREAIKPAETLGAGLLQFDAGLGTANFDFQLEGVPTLTTIQVKVSLVQKRASHDDAPEISDLEDLKHNTAVVAVAAFGIAERVGPIGPRESRAEIESLLKATRLDEQMKTAGLWSGWQSGQRGRFSQ